MEAGNSGETAAHSLLLGLDPLWVSTALLVATYATIMTEKLNRAIVALLGAGLMISLGILNQEQAVEGIDFNTLALLTGMMLIVAIARQSGISQFVAILSAKAARANPAGILAMLGIVTAVLSALLDNVVGRGKGSCFGSCLDVVEANSMAPSLSARGRRMATASDAGNRKNHGGCEAAYRVAHPGRILRRDRRTGCGFAHRRTA